MPRLKIFLKSPRALFLGLSLITLLTLGATAFEVREPQRGPHDPTWAFIQKHKILLIGVDPSLPPFGQFGETRPLGLDPAIGEEIAHRLGVQVQWVLLTYDGLYDSLLLGKTNMVIAALERDPLREAQIRYSSPYFDDGQVIVSREGVQDLAGQRVGVEFASTADLSLRAREDITLERYLTPEEALAAAASGDIDAAVVDRVSAMFYLMANEASGLMIAEAALFPAPYHIAMRRQDWRLQLAVEEALASMRADGTLDALIAQWITPPIPPQP